MSRQRGLFRRYDSHNDDAAFIKENSRLQLSSALHRPEQGCTADTFSGSADTRNQSDTSV